MSHLRVILDRAKNNPTKKDAAVKLAAEYLVSFSDATEDEKAEANALIEANPGLIDQVKLGSLKKRRELEQYNAMKQEQGGD